MAIREKQSQRFIYVRSTREKIPVSEEMAKSYYRETGRIRKREQYYGRCMCPKKYIWSCDGDCISCRYHAAGNIISLDADNCGDGSNLYNSQSIATVNMEDIIIDRILLETFIERLRELDPDADRIIEMLSEDMSDRAIAKQLGRKQRTFADQMKRYRAELRKLID